MAKSKPNSNSAGAPTKAAAIRGYLAAHPTAKTRDIVPVVLRDCTYSWTEEAKAQSLDVIDNFIGYVLDSDHVRQILLNAR